MVITVRELVRQLLCECGRDKRAMQIFNQLEENECAQKLLLVDYLKHGSRYIDGINSEVGFIQLTTEE